MRLTQWLELSGISKGDLARKLGISAGRVSQLLHGDDPWISRELALRIAEVTSGAVTANDFVNGRPELGAEPECADAGDNI